MWLNLNLSDINFKFRIKDYLPSAKVEELNEWVKVDLILQAEEWLNHQINSQKLFLMEEIEKIRDEIKSFISNKTNDRTELGGVEPDLEFVLTRSDDDDALIFMDLKISFWNNKGALTGNTLTLNFNDEETKAFLYYLEIITGLVNTEDKKAKKLIENGIITF